MKKKNLFIKTFLSLSILGLLFIHFYAPRFITEIKNPLIEFIRSAPQTVPTKSTFSKNQEYLTFQSFDDTKLTCLVTYSQPDSSHGTIILLHGIRSNKESFCSLSEKLSEMGYNSVALDSRAHGQSEGQFCTFGVKEKKDISRLIDTLIKTKKLNDNIGVWGQSLGGAIGLQAMSYDKRIKFGIIESTFSDFKTITKDYFKFHLGFQFDPLINYLTYRSGKISDFEPNDAKPVFYCKEIEQPVLLVHGDEDDRINIKYARDNFQNLSSPKKEFLEIKGANHLNVWKTGGDQYFKKVFEFIKENTVGNIGYNPSLSPSSIPKTLSLTSYNTCFEILPNFLATEL